MQLKKKKLVLLDPEATKEDWDIKYSYVVAWVGFWEEIWLAYLRTVQSVVAVIIPIQFLPQTNLLLSLM